jgi:hypothetical protein
LAGTLPLPQSLHGQGQGLCEFNFLGSKQNNQGAWKISQTPLWFSLNIKLVMGFSALDKA